MPINVELYVHVTIDGSDTIIEGYNGFTVKYGNKVDRDKVDSLLDAVEMPEGAIWYGWYEKIDIGDEIDVLVPFNFNRELIEDLVLYPFYSYLEPVHLEYDLNGGTGIIPVDDYSYALGKGAIVLAGEGVIPPDGKVFIGWNTKSDGSGKTYYAGDVAIIDINELKLYAMYGEEPKIGNVNLQYVNTITSEVVSNEYSEYSEIIISDTSIFKEYTSKRYIFKFWNTKSDGSGETFNIGDDIILTSDSENILYAIYEETDLPILNLPISKVLRYYNGLESFKFEFLALLTNENGEVVNNGKEFNGFIIVSDSSLTNGYIEIVYDELELVNGNKFYYKVYEIEDTLNPIFYDTSYYLIEIEIVSDIPTLMNIKKFDNNGIEYPMYAENYLSFVNIYGLDSDALPDTGGSGKNNYKMVSFSISLLGLIVLFIRKKID